MSTARLLIADDEVEMLRLLKRSISQELGCEIETAASGEDALRLIEKKTFDLALCDIRMPGMDGLELLERVKRIDPWLTVVMMTAYGAIEVAVDAIKKGAYDFISKPFDHEEIIRILSKALERGRLLRENLNMRERIREKETFHNLIGASPAMQRVYDTIQMISKTDVTVLITGESGTGKNMVAKAVHALSPRNGKPFIRVSCPTVPENILESELFGYTRGAFTHATTNRKGLFEEADGGTIFLDEIGDISPSVQTKLLQVLEDKEFKPLGQTRTLQVDVRVIASTNQDLKARMRENLFREDLYYRLCVVEIRMPPLLQRREDVPLLVDFFLEKHCRQFNLERKQISPELMGIFLQRKWEGNVRELENIIKRAVVMAPDIVVLPRDIGWEGPDHREVLPCLPVDGLPYREAKERILERFNREYIGGLLETTGGNVTRAAQMCGLERQSLQQVMKRYGIRPEDYRNGA